MLAWLLIPAGIALIVYCEKVATWTGEIDMAERFFGPGGTYTFLKLFGLAFTILAIMWVAGGLQALLRSTFGVFFGTPV